MRGVTGPLFSLSASKTLKKILTYQRRLTGHSVYLYSKPGDVSPFFPSASQVAQRLVVKNLVSAWQALNSGYKAVWDKLAKDSNFTGMGYHYYLHKKGVADIVVQDSGWHSPTLGVNDSSFGNKAWSDTTYIYALDTWWSEIWQSGQDMRFEAVVRLVVSSVVSGDNFSTGSVLPSSAVYIPFGGSSSLWGLSLSAGIVNASDFGVVFATVNGAGDFFSNYLKATGFSFSIPVSAIVLGVLVEIYAESSEISPGNYPSDVDHVRMKVFYYV